jgi:chloramphenicol-sensitive protein RarD
MAKVEAPASGASEVEHVRRGTIYAVLCYLIWGAFPVYFKSLEPVPALQSLAHRMVWSMLFLAVVLLARRQWGWLRAACADRSLLARFGASAVMLSTNWFVYIWACNSDHLVDASLGYFINPLVNVLLGFLFLRERLRPAQWFSIAIAATGVVWLTVEAGQLPWIGLTLAASFALYGLLRKTAPLGALEGLALETLLLSPFALACLLWLGWQGSNAFFQVPPATRALLVAAGPITAIPLLMFAAAARRISFSLLGLLQYICPSLQLLLGVAFYGEPFSTGRALGYGAIWLALLAYSLEAFWQIRRNLAPLGPAQA